MVKPQLRSGYAHVSAEVKLKGKDPVVLEKEFNLGLKAGDAQAGVEVGMTMSPVRFNFVKTSAIVILPCKPEEVKETLDAATEIAQEKMDQNLALLQEQMKEMFKKETGSKDGVDYKG